MNSPPLICLTLLRPDEPDATSGTAEILKRNCMALKSKGYKVFLITPPNDPLIKLVDPYIDGFEIISSTAGKASVGRNLLPAYNIYRRIQPDLVHFHCPNYRWGLDVVIAAGLAKVPHIIRTEQNPLMASPEPHVRLLLNIADRFVDRFYYNCEGNKDRFEALIEPRKGRGRVIINGIDPKDLDKLEHDTTTRESLREEFGFPTDAQVAMFAAGDFGLYRDDFRRPLKPVLDAFKILLEDPEKGAIAKNWRLLVLGSGEVYAPTAEQVVEEMGLSDYVHFAGLRKDFLRILNQVDLVVAASHFEGSALTTFKAWALGVPTLTTKVDGISDVIGKENFKKLMVDHDDLESYVDAWYEFMIGEPYRVTVHQEAGEIVLEEYTINKMMNRYLKEYSDLFNSNSDNKINVAEMDKQMTN